MNKVILAILASVGLGAQSSGGEYQNSYMRQANPSSIHPEPPPSS